MPRFQTFGKWRAFGSDDLTAPYALEALAYGIWILWIVIGLYFEDELVTNECTAGIFVYHFYTYNVLLMMFGLITSCCIIHISLRGTVINAYPRRHIATFLAFKLFLDILSSVVLITATWNIYFADAPQCDNGKPEIYLSGIWSSTKGMWIVMLTVMFGIWHRIIALSSTSSDDRILNCGASLEPDVSVKSEVLKNWRNRLMSVGVEEHAGLDELARFLTSFFKHDINLVPTDVLVCLMRLEQDESNRRLVGAPMLSNLTRSQCCLQPWMTLENAIRYSPFASAAFGWPIFVLRSPFAVRSMLKTVSLGRTLSQKSLFQDKLTEDPWLLNTAVICNLTGIDESNLIHVSYHNRMFEVPFFIAVDHTDKSIIVSIRGTLSMKDVMIDVTAYSNEMIDIPNVCDASAHVGMLNAARCIHGELFGDGKTDPGLMSLAWQHISEHAGKELEKDYKLVITGASLGAGIAALLSLLVYQNKKYRSILQCFAFSAPAGIMSLSTSRYCQKFVCSVILGDDIVGKLSTTSAFNLKIKILNALLNCDIPKHSIVGGWVMQWISHIFGSKQTSAEQSQFQCSPSWTDNVEATKAVLCYQAKIRSAIEETQAECKKHERLYVPGCILYIKETVNKQSVFKSELTYSLHCLNGEHELFQEIVIGRNMITHHNPWTVLKALNSLHEQQQQEQQQQLQQQQQQQ